MSCVLSRPATATAIASARSPQCSAGVRRRSTRAAAFGEALPSTIVFVCRSFGHLRSLWRPGNCEQCRQRDDRISRSDRQGRLPVKTDCRPTPFAHRQPTYRRSGTSQPASTTRSWPARQHRACADWADATDGTHAAGELPARPQAAGARPRHLTIRRTVDALDRQPFRAGDQARVVGRMLRRRLAPRQEQHQRQSDRGPANGGERAHLPKRAAHLLAGIGPLITRSI